jgi:hypothetical protein
MTQYNPDHWVVVKMTPADVAYEPHYRVFATWAGSYLLGSSWKLNSGITGIRQDDTHYEFEGSSGSVYRCHKNMYGTSGYGQGVLNSLIKQYEDEIDILALPADTDFMTLEYT